VKDSREYFEELSASATTPLLEKWEAQISKAEDDRLLNPKAMDIMAAQVPKGTKFISILIQLLIYSGITLAQTRAKLLSTDERGITGVTAWLMSGFKLEEEQ